MFDCFKVGHTLIIFFKKSVDKKSEAQIVQNNDVIYYIVTSLLSIKKFEAQFRNQFLIKNNKCTR